VFSQLSASKDHTQNNGLESLSVRLFGF
jgi:hypothetical protein